MTHRTGLVFLGLLLLAAPSAAQAQFTWTTNADQTLTITGYAGEGGDVTVPDTIDGLTVTIIGTNAFVDETNLSSLTMPAGLLSIGYGAFGECSSLASVTIPAGVTNIGSFAFIFCSSLGSVTIPATVTSIGQAAFQDCASLTNATIAQGVTSLGDDAFLSCSRLASIAIPGSVTNIGEGVFQDCTGLRSAFIGNGVTSLGMEMFQACQSLSGVRIPGSVTNIGAYAFAGTILTGVRIPGSVLSIGDGAFSGASLTNVTLSSNVTSLGQNVFSICPDLTNIIVGAQNLFYSSVQGVLFDLSQSTLLEYPAGLGGTGAYSIPGSVNNVANGAFAGCSLGSVTLPAGVTNLGESAFYDCTNLHVVFFEGNAPTADPSAFESDSNATIYYLPGAIGWSSPFAGLPALLWNPLIQAGGANFGVRSNQFEFNITGTANIVLVLQASANLASQVWQPLQTITLTNGLFYFSEPIQANNSGRYYRLSSP